MDFTSCVSVRRLSIKFWVTSYKEGGIFGVTFALFALFWYIDLNKSGQRLLLNISPHNKVKLTF